MRHRRSIIGRELLDEKFLVVSHPFLSHKEEKSVRKALTISQNTISVF